MKYQQLRKKTEGFTIIEVLIVLAIAGLIMLIVFLAVPSLRRNQQNTTMRSEASRVLSLVTEYESNSNGKQVNTDALYETVVNSAGTLTQLLDTSNTNNHRYGAGTTTVEGSTRLVIGNCGSADGTTAVAVAGRTYALQFVLKGGQQACIES